MKRMLAVLIGVRDGIDRALVVTLVRFTERLVVFGGCGRPVAKAAGHVSGDALARYRYAGMPLQNIWKPKEDHGSDS